ncbi:two-component sensor histidine kinase [Marinobacterium nitratireducens]|uniref:histidine kinase n=1 Tax=Marinobacterium nitratireducens TaxID=518897 RepID=A0A917Z8X1_9GAMM|nr:ATP-binding protein [Marinobacterium nitratireducens]GGO77961.1 two-component sensor histidine kinase [Marinobacterium nitratireducens]
MRLRWPRVRSLRARLLVFSCSLLPVVFFSAWFALQNAFLHSLETAEREQLKLQVYLLLGAAEFQDGRLSIPQALREPRFGQLESGLYGVIQSQSGALQWRSESSMLLPAGLLLALDDTPLAPGDVLFAHLPEHGLYLYQYPVVWEGGGREYHYLINVLETDAPLLTELRAYRNQLVGWLSLLFLLALLVQYVILRWSLKPLDGLARDIKRIESGEADSLGGSYPLEVQPVTANLNLLLDSERRQRERYRNTLGDLAHSLKTPLAVIRGSAEEELPLQEYRCVVDEQVQRMDQIVQYQLARAVKSQGRAISSGVDIGPVLQRITGALMKVYRDKGIEIEVVHPPGLRFAGDERDLMELLGNLLENACKYGRQQVRVMAQRDDADLRIDIEDDGPGVSPQRRDTILQRGARLDTSAPGQGIGLAVAVDILSSYDGELSIDSSVLGGARFRLLLPAMRP